MTFSVFAVVVVVVMYASYGYFKNVQMFVIAAQNQQFSLSLQIDEPPCDGVKVTW